MSSSIRACLRFFSSGAASIPHGGLFHRGRRTYKHHWTGLIYLLTLLYLLYQDLDILSPVRNNEIYRVTKDQTDAVVPHITIEDARKYS